MSKLRGIEPRSKTADEVTELEKEIIPTLQTMLSRQASELSKKSQ